MTTTTAWTKKENRTVFVLCVFPVATNVCENISITISLSIPAGGRPIQPNHRGVSLFSRPRRTLPNRLRSSRGYRRSGARAFLARISVIMPEKHDRASDEYRRISTNNNPAYERERKTVQYRTAPNEQGDHCQKCQTRGHDRPAQRLVDGPVHDHLQRLAAHELQVLANPVENDDRVVHRIAHQREEGRDHGHVDIFIKDGEQPDGDDGVVKARNHRAQAVDPLEPEGNIHQHPGERVQSGKHGFRPQLRAYFRPDHLHIPDVKWSQVALLFERVNNTRVHARHGRELIKIRHQAGARWRVPEVQNIGDEFLKLRLAESHASARQRIAQPVQKLLLARIVELQFSALRLPE